MYLLLKRICYLVSAITDNHLKVEFGKLGCIVKDVQDHYKVVSTGTRVGGLYRLDVTVKRHVALTSQETSTAELWHHKYGHLNYNDLSLLQRKSMVEGLPVMKCEHNHVKLVHLVSSIEKSFLFILRNESMIYLN